MNMKRIVPDAGPVSINRVEVHVLRVPIDSPVRTSFGVMTNRPAVLVRIEDEDGAFGWGEIWCNFPTCGAEHRARLVDSTLAPRLIGRSFSSPEQASRCLIEETRILALQTREYGPIAQSIAGIDVALWDLAARRRQIPLWQLLEGGRRRVPVYASGINPELAYERIETSRTAGYTAFKVKIGFDPASDLDVVHTTLDMLKPTEQLMLDANQAWGCSAALEMVGCLSDAGIDWLEEPMPVDTPDRDWRTLADSSHVPLAGGENFSATSEFEHAVKLAALSVIQPDICKWGGISGCYPVARYALAAGRRLCPHYLGGGIGLVASAHLLAAVGGDGMLEVDSNPNPLREMLARPFPPVDKGHLELTDAAGLGAEPDLHDTARWQVLHTDLH